MYYTGRDGFVTYCRRLPSGAFDCKRVAKVRDWGFDASVRLLPTTTLGDYAEESTPGIKSATGSCELIYYRFEPGEELNTTHYQFTALLKKIIRNGAITEDMKIRLQLNVADSWADRINFDAYINSARIRSAVGELTVASVQFTACGDLIDGPYAKLGSPYVE